MTRKIRKVQVLLFDGFELLDVFGPVGLFSRVFEEYSVDLIAVEPGLVQSSQGTRVEAKMSMGDSQDVDIVLVPGGMGTRQLVADQVFLEKLAKWANQATLVTSVCTGSALLAAAGLLDGYRATSNKRAFEWASSFGSDVRWVRHSRWVQDGDRWTSSGVAAGMDMTAALISELSGRSVGEGAAAEIELEIHRDADWDPFSDFGQGFLLP